MGYLTSEIIIFIICYLFGVAVKLLCNIKNFKKKNATNTIRGNFIHILLNALSFHSAI